MSGIKLASMIVFVEPSILEEKIEDIFKEENQTKPLNKRDVGNCQVRSMD
jgi:hypothetical protein